MSVYAEWAAELRQWREVIWLVIAADAMLVILAWLEGVAG